MKVLESMFMLNLIHDLTSLNKFKCVSPLTVIDTNKINKEIAVFIVFVTLVVLGGLLVKTPVNTNTPVPESQVAGLLIQFKAGTSEPEVKDILQNINMTVNYSMEYDTNTTDEIYYILVDKDKIMDIRSESREVKNWTGYTPAIKKGNYYLIEVPEQIVQDKDFLAMLDKNNLQLKRFIWCEISFRSNDGYKYWIPEEDAIRIKNELEQNENIFSAHLCYIYSS